MSDDLYLTEEDRKRIRTVAKFDQLAAEHGGVWRPEPVPLGDRVARLKPDRQTFLLALLLTIVAACAGIGFLLLIGAVS